MARRKIREHDAKKIIADAIPELGFKSVLITPETNVETLPERFHWLLQEKLTIKPDQLFGKRKKHGLVLIDAAFQGVKDFLQQYRNKEFTINDTEDILTHFIIEPFVPHHKEYYLAITSERDHDTIHFSETGGIDIEENWDNVKTIQIPTFTNIDEVKLEFLDNSEIENKEKITSFIKELYKAFRDLDFTYLEINPFTFDNDGKIVLLDTVARIDDCASFKGQWDLEFPREFGKRQYQEELHIEELDRKSGASLKLTILNPDGKIWNILGGGGASIIYLDMITNLGHGKEIANYGESSGNPSMEESYEYARSILELMTKNNGKVLFIVGGIANFTDVRSTFKGTIKALEEYADQLKDVTIFVRRGGPHHEEGLRLMKGTGEKLGIRMYVHGPETSMPEIITIAGGSL
ncbi:ATPase [Candidatus Woesearchaeota archaeon CG10_big_fil_rev_8_21_14_0_10_45_16]|nr:MAG: ATPase [Candidatus Woesearchaeota archaeon CG10_big_fil_rev_8_21_14_0_10_45_16]